MSKSTLRELFKEFPDMPEDILLAASDDPAMLYAIRQRDRYIVVYDVDHELSAKPMVPGVTMENLGSFLAEGEPELLFNGRPVKYRTVTTVEILEGVL